MPQDIFLTGVERSFDQDDIIVSKTDLKGRITYANGTISGYHSSRRVPEELTIAKVKPLYEQLRAEERRHSDPKAGLNASTKILIYLLEENGVTYDQFVLSL